MRTFLIGLARRAKSLPALEMALRHNLLYYPACRKTIERMEALRLLPALDQLIAMRADLTARTLGWASGTAYGRAFAGKPLASWPILPKEAIRACPDDFVAPHYLKIPAATGGTSGIPLKLWRSLRNLAAEGAFVDFLLAPAGAKFGSSRVAILRGNPPPRDKSGVWPISARQGRRQLILAGPQLNPETFDDFFKVLSAFKPEILWIQPSGGEYLASLMIERNLQLPVKAVFSSSEMLLEGAWSRLGRAFPGARIIDSYGQAERVCLSVQPDPLSGWLVPAYGFVELLPDPDGFHQLGAGNDTVDGQAVRLLKVVATGFWNEVMPLVRYDTGDWIAVPAGYTTDELKLVALGIKPFIRIMGRGVEYLLTPDGGRIFALNFFPREVKHLLRLQLIQRQPDTLEVRALVEAGFDQESMNQLMTNIRTKLPESVLVDVVFDQPLLRTARGKVPYVIREC